MEQDWRVQTVLACVAASIAIKHPMAAEVRRMVPAPAIFVLVCIVLAYTLAQRRASQRERAYAVKRLLQRHGRLTEDGQELTRDPNVDKLHAPRPSPSSSAAAAAMYVPLRLTPEERKLLSILQSSLNVSEYTDNVDIYTLGATKVDRIMTEIRDVCQTIVGLLCGADFKAGARLLSRSLSSNGDLLRQVFEIGRRYKVMNPSMMRGGYGKLMSLLMDATSSRITHHMGFSSVAPIQTVGRLLVEKGAERLLVDPRLETATQQFESESDGAALSKLKQQAMEDLVSAYAGESGSAARGGANGDSDGKIGGNGGSGIDKVNGGGDGDGSGCEGKGMLEDEEVRRVVQSMDDYRNYLLINQEPIDRVRTFLLDVFEFENPRPVSLSIRPGKGGSCLRHSHQEQFLFVLQTLTLWREIVGSMYMLWSMTDEDLLDPSNPYALRDTGQGLHRLQQSPRVRETMSYLLRQVQSEAGPWVGLSVVHLGDRDVPNGLVFIDKYAQLSDILRPLVLVLDAIGDMKEGTAERDMVDKHHGGVDALRISIMADFFKHAFDGSGDDGGSCIDGRLTSAWNWCSKIQSKPYYPIFLLTGFVGFNGPV